jgi:hypothetical protein
MSFILLGILNAQAAGAGGYTGPAYDLLQTENLSSPQASITFSNVNQYATDYEHLQIRFVGRSSRVASDPLIIKLDNTTQVRSHHLYGAGSTPSSGDGGTSYAVLYALAGTNTGSTQAGAGIIDVFDPFSGNKRIAMRSISGVPGKEISVDSSLHAYGPISSIYLQPFSGTNFATNSRVSLYGLRKG